MKFDREDHFFPGHFDDQQPSPIEGSDFRFAAAGQAGRLALIGCFRPRQCGIATFTADVFDHLSAYAPNLEIDVYAMRSQADQAVGAEVRQAIDEGDEDSYRSAARAINASGADAVWLQHEFGIFGGPAGAMVLELVDRIAAPLVVTLHTILADPSPAQRRVMDRLVARASKLVVMSDYGRTTLTGIYGASPDQVVLIEHGTPDRPFEEVSALRQALGLADRPILSTFGLIGPGKGLEAAIRALPAVVAQYPDILYRIVGATHPNLVAAEGEAYRDSLQQLATSLGVASNIAWENRFLDTEDLLDQIELCDIYLAPYPNLQQITSGTLAYAVALGRAVISTPFVHARELLANDVGILLPGAESDAISEALLMLLAVPDERRAVQRRAYDRGRQTTWSAIARQCAALVDEVVGGTGTKDISQRAPALAGVWAMCDDTGMFQHAVHLLPDRAHGYCIDDNARALMLVHSLPANLQEESAPHARAFASFIEHGWNESVGAFRNFMGYDRRWLEERGSEDSNGRTLWALGHATSCASDPHMREWAARLFDHCAPMALRFKNPRAIAFAVLGADERLERDPENALAREMIERGGAFLCALWKTGRRPGWDWFEAGLSYDNARLAEALMRAGRRMPSLPHEEAGLAALDWLATFQTAEQGHFRAVGSESFDHAGEALPFDQQPLEAWATVAACGTSYRLTGQTVWRDHAETAYAWFLGRNDRGIALGDIGSGRCFDGLTPRGVNRNSGAESILAFHLAHRTIADTIWRSRSPASVASPPRSFVPAMAG